MSTCRSIVRILTGLTLVGAGASAPGETDFSMSRFLAHHREAQREFEDRFVERVEPARLRAYHASLTDRPHRAGTPGDLAVIEEISAEFERLGLEVETHWIEVLLAEPVDAEVSILSPVQRSLALKEPALGEDPWSSDERLEIGWNAYSASGVAEGEVVYANYGTREDFEHLRDLGVLCEGRIVVARYGRNFRGYKAKYAQEAGAAGLILYTDPEDSGFAKGPVYPEGGYANEHSIQRGSIKTLDWVGDPLTPGVAATAGERVERLDPDEVALPRIPVQPVGWKAASEILSRMEGRSVPEQWQGGLPFAYRLTGGPGLTVRVRVEQERRLVRTANVVGTLRGGTYPEEQIVLGCHHDAWGFGASDPNAGLMCLMECARVFAEMAREGERPERTIRFGAWGAEEFGIIGSTEWAEAHKAELSDTCIAYINLDMAAMGPDFRASAAPTLKQLVVDSSRVVPQARRPGATVHEYWVARSGRDATEPAVGNLGGGSDHVAFYCHLGIPSISLGAGGSEGVAYHSNYDTLAWYRRVVGEDYEPAAMIARMAGVVASRLANADILPIDYRRYARDFRMHMAPLRAMAGERVDDALWARLEQRCAELEATADGLDAFIEAVMQSNVDTTRHREGLNLALGLIERGWCLSFKGEDKPERAFYRSRYVAPDPTSGYRAWMLPQLRRAIEFGTDEEIERAIGMYADRLSLLEDSMDRAAVEIGFPPLNDALREKQ